MEEEWQICPYLMVPRTVDYSYIHQQILYE